MVEVYKPQIGQIGSQLPVLFNLFDGSILNPDAIHLEEYERMLDTDETVGAAYDFLVLSVLGLLGEYQHEDAKIEAFVQDAFAFMEGTVHEVCLDILSAVWAGFSVTEIVWQAKGGQVLPGFLATYHPATITFQLDEAGRLRGLLQRRYMQAVGSEIPPEKCLIFTYNKRFNNYYGRSGFMRIRKNWLLKDTFLKMWGRGLDKFGTPLLVAVVPDGAMIDPETGNEISHLDYATKVLANLQSGTALAFSAKMQDSDSADKGRLPDIKALAAGGAGIGEAFDRAVGYLNKMICRGLLIPSLVFDEGSRTGSYALGTSHFDAFMQGVRALCGQLKDTLLEQLVRRMVEYNFGPQEHYGSFRDRTPDPEELKLMSEIFLNLVNAGIMDPGQADDFRYMRGVFGQLPDRRPEARVGDLVQAAREVYPRYLRGQEGV